MNFESAVHAAEQAFTAVERGAALVYHRILDTGVAIASWEVSHPEIAPLIQLGQDYATSVLTRYGVPLKAVEIISEDTLAALKQMAAQDATVPVRGHHDDPGFAGNRCRGGLTIWQAFPAYREARRPALIRSVGTSPGVRPADVGEVSNAP